jgi:hypothetical protein
MIEIEMTEIRASIRDAVSSLHELDDRLAVLAENLALPPDAAEMWDSRIPMSFTPNLFAALDAVRTDCIQVAVATLLRAVRQSDDSLRREWAQLATRIPIPAQGGA